MTLNEYISVSDLIILIWCLNSDTHFYKFDQFF
jgi:hypothetical protein